MIALLYNGTLKHPSGIELVAQGRGKFVASPPTLVELPDDAYLILIAPFERGASDGESRSKSALDVGAVANVLAEQIGDRRAPRRLGDGSAFRSARASKTGERGHGPRSPAFRRRARHERGDARGDSDSCGGTGEDAQVRVCARPRRRKRRRYARL